MKAIGCVEHGAPEDVLAFLDVPAPEPGPRDLLVKVHAASVNPVDAKVVHGIRGPGRIENPPLIPGFDASGVVERAGASCTRFREGDAVFFAGDIGRPGAHAEYVAVDERIVGRKPETLSDAEAAALPLTAITAWEAFVENMAVPADGSAGDRTALVVGGAGGVGSIALQVAKRVCGFGRVAGTASRDASRDACRAFGADVVLDHTKSLREQSDEAGIEGYDCILSTADARNFASLVDVLAPLGRICYILPAAEPLDVSGLFMKRGSLTFEMMFARPRLGFEPERQGALLDRVADLLDEKTLRTTLRETLDWARFAEAYREIASGHTIGKIVLAIAGR